MTRIKTFTLLTLLGLSTCILNAAVNPRENPADLLPGMVSKTSVPVQDAQQVKNNDDLLDELFGTISSSAGTPAPTAAAKVDTIPPVSAMVSGTLTPSTTGSRNATLVSTTMGAGHTSRSGRSTAAVAAWGDVPVATKPTVTLKDHCNSLAGSGLPEQQRTFDPTLQFSLPDGEEGEKIKAGLKEYVVQNVCILYDVSSSTYTLGDGGSGGGRGGRGGGGGRFSRVMMVDEEASVLSSCLVPDALTKSQPKTKPIFLAQAEGLSLLLKSLAYTDAKLSLLYLLPFDDKPHLPIGINFPQMVKDQTEYTAIAENLDTILPYSGGGTSLAPALTLMMRELQKRMLADTLLVIVTDGQTDDSDATGRLLTELSSKLSAAEHRLDILTIGAGSIVSQSKAGLMLNVNDAGRLMLSGTRMSHFSHTTGGHSSYSGAQCNDAYLKALTYFKSDKGGRGRYCGAYTDYQDMIQVITELLSGANDGSYELWVQGDGGNFWAPKAHQWDIVKDYKANGKEAAVYEYDKNTVHALVNKDTAAGGVLRITDDYGKIRCYLFEQKSQLQVAAILDAQGNPTRTFTVTSAFPEIQARIDWINAHPYC